MNLFNQVRCINRTFFADAHPGSGLPSYAGTPMKESVPIVPQLHSEAKQEFEVELRMASVCYVHSANFLEEINSCAADFKQYMSNLAQSIRMAATEIALGIVHRRAEAMSHQNTMDEAFGTPPRTRRAFGNSSFRSSTPYQGGGGGSELYYSSLGRGGRIMAPAPTPRADPKKTPEVRFNLDVVMETPILVVPRHERSFEVLVAHLGEITVQNQVFLSPRGGFCSGPDLPSNAERVDRYFVSVTDMNVHSIDLTKKAAQRDDDCREEDSLHLLSILRLMKAQDLYSCDVSAAVPILHDTAVDLRIDKAIIAAPGFMKESESYNSFVHCGDADVGGGYGDAAESTVLYQMHGRVMNPLKLSVYRYQYELILDSVKSLFPGGEDSNAFNVSSSSGSGGAARKTSVGHQSSVESGAGGEMSHIESSFAIPQLILELRGDLMNSASGKNKDTLVRLECQEFAFTLDKSEPYSHTVEIALKSLVMEDLQLDKNSKHRKLMTSISDDADRHRVRLAKGTSGLSSSCPGSQWNLAAPVGASGLSHGSSLPDRLNAEAYFSGHRLGGPATAAGRQFSAEKATAKSTLRPPSQPSTPPPSCVSSPRASPVFDGGVGVKRDIHSEDNLVHIKVVDIDAGAPDFLTRHNCTNRYVDVDFNTLDIMFNLQTWVIVLDFFGIGSGPSQAPKSAPVTRRIHPRPNETAGKKQQPAEHMNCEIEVKVRSLSIVLNNPDYEVASAAVKNYTSTISLREGNFAVGGRLGSFSLKDHTAHGALYKDRFLSRGENVLTFHLFKYGGPPDEKLQRPYDAMLKIRMASIIYVHTHRFYSEIMSFFNQFHQLQSVMNRIREAAAGGSVKEIAARGTRLKLDIAAGSPLLLLPMSSHSADLLTVDLGSLDICNSFKFSGDEGTISAETLSSANAGDVLGSRRSRRSGSSRSSVRSRSSAKSPVSVRSGGFRRDGRRFRGPSSNPEASDGVFDGQEEEDELRSLPSEKKKCLLDVLLVSCRDADLRTAERLSAFTDEESLDKEDILVGSFIVRLQKKPLLKEKFELKLQLERNLDKAFSHRVPDMSVKGVLSRLHAVVDVNQYMLIRGLLGYNFGEPLDDLDFQVPTNEYQDPSTHTLLTGNVWTGMFMNFELQDVILDFVLAHSTPKEKEKALARINFFRSRLIYESFSDSSRDVDLVSQEILLSDLRFVDCPANKRSNVFAQILQPMAMDERNSPLQAEVHFRATETTNRFTILLNNMRLMGIFDWWLAVLEFISKSAENPLPSQGISAARGTGDKNKQHREEKQQMRQKVFLQEEPLYPSAGVISRRAPIVESKGPVFELKLNVTDSEFIIVADSSQSDSSTVILRSTTVIAFRPDMTDRPFSCNLNNAEVFSCVLGREEESALSIIDPVTINFEIGGRASGAKAVSKGLLDIAESEGGFGGGFGESRGAERTAEIQLQQLNIRLSYHDWLMFKAILDSFPRQAREAMYGKEEVERSAESPQRDPPPPSNVQAQVSQLAAMGFSRSDCHFALTECKGNVNDAALWLTQNATPEAAANSLGAIGGEPDSAISAESSTYLKGSSLSFSNIELKTSSINICIIDDCKDADVPLLEVTLSHLHLKHGYCGEGEASSLLSGSYYNRALSSWEPFMEPWRCGFDWRLRPIGANGNGQKLSLNVNTSDVMNFNLTSTLIELYQMVKTNWTEDYYNAADDLQQVQQANFEVFRRRRTPFVPFALINSTGRSVWFSTQTRMSGSQFGPSRTRAQSGVEMQWKHVGPGDTLPFQFEERGKLRHLNTHDMKIHQILVRVEGWRETTPVSVDRVGTYFRKAMPEHLVSLNEVAGAAPPDMPPARLVFDVTLDGSARKLIDVRSALLVENKLPQAVDLKMENTALKIGGN